MNDKKVLVFVGMPGAGKSTLVDYLQQKALPTLYFGGIVVDEVKRRGLEVNETNEKTVREELRATEGKDALAKRILAKIDELFGQGQETVVVDGVYSWTEYKVFKERFGDNAIVIAVAAPRKARHERLAERPVRPFSDEQVTAREYAEIENLEKGGPIANADYTIVNDSTSEDMTAKLDALLSEVGVQ